MSALTRGKSQSSNTATSSRESRLWHPTYLVVTITGIIAWTLLLSRDGTTIGASNTGGSGISSSGSECNKPPGNWSLVDKEIAFMRARAGGYTHTPWETTRPGRERAAKRYGYGPEAGHEIICIGFLNACWRCIHGQNTARAPRGNETLSTGQSARERQRDPVGFLLLVSKSTNTISIGM